MLASLLFFLAQAATDSTAGSAADFAKLSPETQAKVQAFSDTARRALDRYKALGIWGRDTRLPRSGYERLRAGLVSGGLVSVGTPYETAVDNSLAERVLAEDPPALTVSDPNADESPG